MESQTFSLAELCTLTDFSKRTVRYYMQLGLVDRPIGETRSAHYLDVHLEQLLRIKKLTDAGVSLERIREVLRASKVPTVCLAGHVHWNTLTTIDGIPHLSQQSLTESFVMSSESGAGKPCGSFGLLHITTDNIDYQVVGADAFRCILPLAQTARRWYSPMGKFDELADHSERQARIAAFQSQAQAAQ